MCTRDRKARERFHLAGRIKTAFMPNEPVLHEGRIYSAETSDDDKPVIRAYGQDEKLIWELEADGRGDLILAGNQLMAVGGGRITLHRLATADQSGRESRVEIGAVAGVERLLAADGKLFAVTLDGRIMAFGEAPSRRVSHESQAAVDEPPNPAD